MTIRHALRLALAAIAAAAALAAPAGAATGPALSVDATADQHPISPAIYGMNFADPTFGAELGLPVDRWGGNLTDTYNWQLGAANHGADYYFENTADCFDAAHGYCSGMTRNTVYAYRDFVAKDRGLGATTLLTLPMMGRVARDAPVAHPLTCGFPAGVYPTQDGFDPFDTNCGNGLKGGAPLPSIPSLTGQPIDARFDAAWVRDLTRRYGRAATGGVGIYELGNEPALWSDSHRGLHPAPETATELLGKSLAVANAVKLADPTAKILGFSEWGWPAYFCSGADTPGSGCGRAGCTTSPDCANHGNLAMSDWYLQRFHAADQAAGRRRLDYFDLHYYSQGGTTTDVTRSLWDPTYVDPSWIADTIDLIPRMKAWVAADYPGTKISLGEYNLSVSADPVVNALIQADALGIFAREGVDLATRWPLSNDGSLIPDAFRIYRDYDGSHSRFGDAWVRATSADQGQLAAYAARRTTDGAYTVLVINKTAGSLTSPLGLAHLTPATTAQVWQWAGSGIARTADQVVSAGGFTATYPARSMTLFVLAGTPAPVACRSCAGRARAAASEPVASGR